MTRTTFARLRLRRVRRLTAGTTDHEHPAWSPDGRILSFAAGPVDGRRVYLVDRKGHFACAVAPSGPVASRPRWAPDGRRIAFDARPLEGPPVVLVQDLPEVGLEPRPLIASRGVAHASIHAAFSPDGRALAYASDEGSPRQFHIWMLEMESGERRQLTAEVERNDAHPAFSPDGTLLAFHRYFGENANQSSLFLLNVTSGALLRLSDAPGFDKHACFATPEVIVFHREHPDGFQELRALHVVEGYDVPLHWNVAGSNRSAQSDEDKRDAKQPAVRVTRRGRIRVAFAGRPRETVAGSARPYDLYVGALEGLQE